MKAMRSLQNKSPIIQFFIGWICRYWNTILSFWGTCKTNVFEFL